MFRQDRRHSEIAEHKGRWPPHVRRSINGKYRFYEKVVKVKADVAAILNSFPRTPISPERVD
jgi:hypothetical protein